MMSTSSLCLRRYFVEAYYYLEDSSPTLSSSSSRAQATLPETPPVDWDEDASPSSTAVPAHVYIQRVASLHAAGGAGFAREFAALRAAEETSPPEDMQVLKEDKHAKKGEAR